MSELNGLTLYRRLITVPYTYSIIYVCVANIIQHTYTIAGSASLKVYSTFYRVVILLTSIATSI